MLGKSNQDSFVVSYFLLIKSYIYLRHMADEALEFVKDSLAAGAQPIIVRKILQDKCGFNHISKDLMVVY